MDKKEEIILEENLNEKETVSPKNSKKIKYAIAIIASTLVLATVSILLIGHFKFNWFKSENYNLDVNISRSVYQANFFSERKTGVTKISLIEDIIEESTYYVDSNFVVYILEQEKAKNGYLYTASLIILDSKVSTTEVNKDLSHLNIFDEAEIKEFESNPEGSKYPIVIFKFYEDGTIEDIQLPNNMDEYNARTLVELIETVIPKLSRNRKEDMSNGLEIDVKKDKKKTIIVKREPTNICFPPKEELKEKMAGYGNNKVRATIEDDQITNIETISDIHLKSEPKKGEITFGPKDFYYSLISEIVAKGIKYQQKEIVELIKKLSKKCKFIKYKKLLESFKQKQEAEEVVEEEIKPTRNLGFPYSASKTFNVVSFNFLGQTMSLKYVVTMSSSSCSNKIVFSSGMGSFTFGNQGVSGASSNSKSYSIRIFKFAFPSLPAVTIGCSAKGSLSWSVGVDSGSGSNTKYYASLTGSLSLGAEILSGWDSFKSLTASASGTVYQGSGKVIISNGSISKGSGFSIRFGQLKVTVKANGAESSVNIYNGWISI